MLRWLLASFHLLALGIGMGAVFARGRALRTVAEPRGVARVLWADSAWGIAALLWISTGLLRAFGPFEKGSAYYLHNHFFYLKMTCFAAILLLEIAPMRAFLQWRDRLKRGEPIDTSAAVRYARLSGWQAALLGVMVFAAAAMARGMGVGR